MSQNVNYAICFITSALQWIENKSRHPFDCVHSAAVEGHEISSTHQIKTPPGVSTPSGDHWPKSGNGFPFDRTFTLFGAYGTTDRNYLGSLSG